MGNGRACVRPVSASRTVRFWPQRYLHLFFGQSSRRHEKRPIRPYATGGAGLVARCTGGISTSGPAWSRSPRPVLVHHPDSAHRGLISSGNANSSLHEVLSVSSLASGLAILQHAYRSLDNCPLTFLVPPWTSQGSSLFLIDQVWTEARVAQDRSGQTSKNPSSVHAAHSVHRQSERCGLYLVYVQSAMSIRYQGRLSSQSLVTKFHNSTRRGKKWGKWDKK